MLIALGVLIVLFAGREYWLLHVLVARADRHSVTLTPAGNEEARRILEKVLAAWVLGGDGAKWGVRYRLACLYAQALRFEEAIQQFQHAISQLAPHSHAAGQSGVMSELHQRLADCLEATGDAAGAQRELASAMRYLEDDSAHDRNSVTYWTARGRLFSSQRRFQEAYESYLRSVELTPAEPPQARLESKMHLLTTAFEAGRPDLTITHAQEVISGGIQGHNLLLAHKMAGVAYGARNELEASEAHRLRALEIAEAANNKDEAADLLVQLAEVRRKRGQLEQALEMCDRAQATSGYAHRMIWLVRSETLRAMGRFEESLASMQQASEATGLNVVEAERRAQAVLALGMAVTAAEAKQGEVAWNHLQNVTREANQDPKLGLWYTAAESWILTLLGRHDQAAPKSAEIEARAPEFAEDNETQLLCRSVLALIAFLRADYALSLQHNQTYLGLNPAPLGRATALYYTGECQRHLGNIDAARTAFQEAIGMGMDTHYTRLAQRSLDELQAPVTQL